MGKRKRHEPEYIKNKIRKLEEKLKQREEELATESPTLTPPEETETPIPLEPQPLAAEADPEPELEPSTESTTEALPEEFLLALGHEGEEKEEHGEPMASELALRWTKIMTDGLKKDQKEALLTKYPTPTNFPAAVAPILNKEISATLFELSLNRDKRMIARQNMTGKLMITFALTDILKGNISSKKLIEEINDAAKIAPEMYHMDTNSRKFFALSNATKTVQETCKETKTGKFLFGENLHDQLKAIKTIKRTAQQIKVSENKKVPTTKPVNWRSPPQYQPSQRGRGGHQPVRRQAPFQPPRRPPPSRGTPRYAPAPRRSHHRRF